MNRRLVIIISLIYVVFMAISFFYLYSKGNTYLAMVAIGGVVAGAVPLHMAFFSKWQLNLGIVISYIIFLFASQFLGSILDWYSFGWWDTFMHFLSGGILGFISLVIYEGLIHKNNTKDLAPWFVSLITVAIAALAGVIWEIYEFNTDHFFGTTLQGVGVTDTMTDLTADVVGAIVISIYAGIRIRIRLKKQT